MACALMAIDSVIEMYCEMCCRLSFVDGGDGVSESASALVKNNGSNEDKETHCLCFWTAYSRLWLYLIL